MSASSSPPRVRPATPADLPRLAAVAEATFRAAFADANDPADIEAYVADAFAPAWLAQELADPRVTYLVADADGELVGYAKLRAGTPDPAVRGARPVELERIYAARPGGGVGAALLRACLGAAAAAGHRTLWLGVWEHNLRAIAFYRREGFTPVGTHAFQLGSAAQTDVVMVRPLPEPVTAAWRHRDVRDGFEVAFLRPSLDGWTLTGASSLVEGGVAWTVRYTIAVDHGWRSRRAEVVTSSAAGTRTVALDAVADGRWRVDGGAARHLDGLLDVDVEASAATTTLPLRRLVLTAGQRADAPAAWVRLNGDVERLEQTYARLDGDGQRYDYRAPAFDVRSRLVFAADGFVADYPGIAVRVHDAR